MHLILFSACLRQSCVLIAFSSNDLVAYDYIRIMGNLCIHIMRFFLINFTKSRVWNLSCKLIKKNNCFYFFLENFSETLKEIKKTKKKVFNGHMLTYTDIRVNATWNLNTKRVYLMKCSLINKRHKTSTFFSLSSLSNICSHNSIVVMFTFMYVDDDDRAESNVGELSCAIF